MFDNFYLEAASLRIIPPSVYHVYGRCLSLDSYYLGESPDRYQLGGNLDLSYS